MWGDSASRRPVSSCPGTQHCPCGPTRRSRVKRTLADSDGLGMDSDGLGWTRRNGSEGVGKNRISPSRIDPSRTEESRGWPASMRRESRKHAGAPRCPNHFSELRVPSVNSQSLRRRARPTRIHVAARPARPSLCWPFPSLSSPSESMRGWAALRCDKKAPFNLRSVF